jgi:hypothetical protein
MLTMVWNPHGFHLVSLLPKGQKWTIQDYVDHILPEICTLRDATDHRKLVVHADNARPHVAKTVKQYLEDNNLKSAPHPPYSQDCSKGQNSRLQKSFSMGWFEFWLTFHSRPWWLHFTNGCRGPMHALMVMEMCRINILWFKKFQSNFNGKLRY